MREFFCSFWTASCSWLASVRSQKRIITAFDRSWREKELVQFLNWNSRLLNVRIYSPLFCPIFPENLGTSFPCLFFLETSFSEDLHLVSSLGVCDSFTCRSASSQSQKMHQITQRSPSLFGNDLCWGETIYVLHIYKS